MSAGWDFVLSMAERTYASVYAIVFFFKQKTAYEMSLRDWSSDVCSSDLVLLIVVLLSGIWGLVLQNVLPRRMMDEIGRASCRERVCNDVEISVVAGSVKKKKRTPDRKCGSSFVKARFRQRKAEK